MSSSTSSNVHPRLERWQKGWDSGRYSVAGQAFHKAEVNPFLATHMPLLQLRPSEDVDKQDRVLVPLCGKTVDMVYFADQKISVIGLEAIPRAIQEFAEEIVKSPQEPGSFRLHKDAQHNWKPNGNGYVGIVEGDALEFKVDEKGPVDAIWDRAALIALRPEDRDAYVLMLHDSLKPGGRVLLSVVEHDMVMVPEVQPPTGTSEPYGPPYSITKEYVSSLFSKFNFNLLQELERQDLIAEEPRWQGKGATKFEQVCYLLEKKMA